MQKNIKLFFTAIILKFVEFEFVLFFWGLLYTQHHGFIVVQDNFLNQGILVHLHLSQHWLQSCKTFGILSHPARILISEDSTKSWVMCTMHHADTPKIYGYLYSLGSLFNDKFLHPIFEPHWAVPRSPDGLFIPQNCMSFMLQPSCYGYGSGNFHFHCQVGWL